jgi:hypothetical protein
MSLIFRAFRSDVEFNGSLINRELSYDSSHKDPSRDPGLYDGWNKFVWFGESY